MAKRLHKGNESIRAGKIMAASRAGDANLLPQLLARLDSNETYENKRHIVRALGNVGDPKAEAKLLELLQVQRGLMLGDIAEALGKLRSRRAVPMLRSLSDHKLEWVRQCANRALKRFQANKS
jgi:HEAT repeat protein